MSGKENTRQNGLIFEPLAAWFVLALCFVKELGNKLPPPLTAKLLAATMRERASFLEMARLHITSHLLNGGSIARVFEATTSLDKVAALDRVKEPAVSDSSQDNAAPEKPGAGQGVASEPSGSRGYALPVTSLAKSFPPPLRQQDKKQQQDEGHQHGNVELEKLYPSTMQQ